MKALLLCAVVALGCVSGAAAGWADADADHAAWDGMLKRHVSRGLVDYAGWQADRQPLEDYLKHLADIQPDHLPSRDAKLAFWINAYNAAVIKGVLDHALIRSVKDVRGFFDKIRYRIGQQPMTLNEIEAAGRALGDWRMHFAVVCASLSCPPLINEAYVPGRLEAQLAERTTAFLADQERGLRVEGKTLWVSKIFQWYTRDFLGDGSRLTADTLLAAVQAYLTQPLRAQRGRGLSLKFLEYDWTLNAQ